jgi:hypothetical protein
LIITAIGPAQADSLAGWCTLGHGFCALAEIGLAKAKTVPIPNAVEFRDKDEVLPFELCMPRSTLASRLLISWPPAILFHHVLNQTFFPHPCSLDQPGYRS